MAPNVVSIGCPKALPVHNVTLVDDVEILSERSGTVRDGGSPADHDESDFVPREG